MSEHLESAKRGLLQLKSPYATLCAATLVLVTIGLARNFVGDYPIGVVAAAVVAVLVSQALFGTSGLTQELGSTQRAAFSSAFLDCLPSSLTFVLALLLIGASTVSLGWFFEMLPALVAIAVAKAAFEVWLQRLLAKSGST